MKKKSSIPIGPAEERALITSGRWGSLAVFGELNRLAEQFGETGGQGLARSEFYHLPLRYSKNHTSGGGCGRIPENRPDSMGDRPCRNSGKIWSGNVYAELGAVFAATSAAQPELCAGILGTLIRGMGVDHLCWGTDSVWFGSPQWQIEALRRFEIPEAMQKKYGFSPLGPADGNIRQMIFGQNSARLYGVDISVYRE